MSQKRIQELVKTLNLQAHPEGGFYAETYRSSEEIPGKDRQLMTSIYFCLPVQIVRVSTEFNRMRRGTSMKGPA